MKFNSILAILVCAICLFNSCKSESGEQTETPATTKETNPTMSADQAILPGDLPASPGANTATAPGMNPPHGQPGHRCDISVGAPLDGAPAPAATTAPVFQNAEGAGAMKQATPPPSIKPSSPAATTATAPGMNPPHGQPGHRCDISVGAPLDSKPKQ